MIFAIARGPPPKKNARRDPLFGITAGVPLWPASSGDRSRRRRRRLPVFEPDVVYVEAWVRAVERGEAVPIPSVRFTARRRFVAFHKAFRERGTSARFVPIASVDEPLRSKMLTAFEVEAATEPSAQADLAGEQTSRTADPAWVDPADVMDVHEDPDPPNVERPAQLPQSRVV